MMAITTSSSMIVNPRRDRSMRALLEKETGNHTIQKAKLENCRGFGSAPCLAGWPGGLAR
jgi:hypothetical protein